MYGRLLFYNVSRLRRHWCAVIESCANFEQTKHREAHRTLGYLMQHDSARIKTKQHENWRQSTTSLCRSHTLGTILKQGEREPTKWARAIAAASETFRALMCVNYQTHGRWRKCKQSKYDVSCNVWNEKQTKKSGETMYQLVSALMLNLLPAPLHWMTWKQLRYGSGLYHCQRNMVQAEWEWFSRSSWLSGGTQKRRSVNVNKRWQLYAKPDLQF